MGGLIEGSSCFVSLLLLPKLLVLAQSALVFKEGELKFLGEGSVVPFYGCENLSFCGKEIRPRGEGWRERKGQKVIS